MHIEAIRDYCLEKKGVTESFPFDEHTLVFKVMNKMFLLASLNTETLRINLKCSPENAIRLRERYPAVRPAFHQNKSHWNTVVLDGTLDNRLITQWIDDSYSLVVSKLPKKLRIELNNTV